MTNKTITAADIKTMNADAWAKHFSGAVDFDQMTDDAVAAVADIATLHGDTDLRDMALDELIGRGADVSAWTDEE